MGLDVSSYSQIRFTHEEDGEYENEDERCLVEAEVFIDREDGLKGGWYSYADKYGFRVGPYSYYNKWRDSLCQAINGMVADELWALVTEDYAAAKNFVFMN